MISDCDWAQQQQLKSSKLGESKVGEHYEKKTLPVSLALIVEMGQK